MRRQFQLGGDFLGQVAHGADIDTAKAERLCGEDGGLGREGGVDDAQDEGFQEMGALDLQLPIRGDAVQAREVGQPDQQQRRIADELLVAGQGGDAGFPFGVLHRDHTPDLKVRRRRGGLRGGDQRFQSAVGQGIGQEAADRAVVQDGFQHLVPPHLVQLAG